MVPRKYPSSTGLEPFEFHSEYEVTYDLEEQNYVRWITHFHFDNFCFEFLHF